MTMTFSTHSTIDVNGMLNISDFSFWPGTVASAETSSDEIHILRDKLRMPSTEGIIGRPRLSSLLSKSVQQFPATLISGRAGTGKTMLAADFAAGFSKVCWYSIESTDISWRVFSRYFAASIPGKPNDSLPNVPENQIGQSEIAAFLLKNVARLYGTQGAKSLIVLDDIHHIFDVAWFDDFLTLLLYSMPSDTHLLILCRSKPPSPLWRLRSKQMLNVIDEKIIAFTVAETEALFDSIDFPAKMAKKANEKHFGRVSKLLRFAEERKSASTGKSQ